MLFRYVSGNLPLKVERGKPRKPTIYFPNCSCFVREGKDVSQHPKANGNTGIMMILEVLLGCVILGLVIVVISWTSYWFSYGHSTRTERAIIMLWMAEGAFGLLLPLISIKELVMVFILLPFYAFFLSSPNIQNSQYLLFLGFVLVGIFIAPVWGFVIVSQMLVKWGNCVDLF